MSSSISKIERGASLAVLVMALGLGAGAAKADDTTGFYVGALGVVNFTETARPVTDVPEYPKLSGISADVSHKTGWGAGVLAGYDFGSFRLQGDVVFRRNKFDKISERGLEYDLSGKVSSYAPMVSALYDISTGSSLTPYIGAGIGASRNKIKDNSFNESKWSFAYQGIAGVNYDLSANIGLGAEYRYFATGERTIGKYLKDYKYDNHSLFLGVTYKFGAAPAAPIAPAVAVPPPPPPPAATPELARSYLVFFDWNASAITSEAAAIINEAAAAAKKLAVTRIDLTGHADRSGTPAYNQKLSEKRAVAVKNALVQLGIPANEISVVAKGETSPLVPTADGVREPQNRRVEIVLP